MPTMKTVHLLYGKKGMDLIVPDSAQVLTGQDIPPAADAEKEVLRALLAAPIESPPLPWIVKEKKPRTVAITISDITRTVPNRVILPPLLQILNQNEIADSQIVIIIGTGMHRESTSEERELLVGREILDRIEVIDHQPRDRSALVKVSDRPPVYLNKRFAEADLRIVTGYIEAHFMAGFSGGRKGVCPALVDLETVQRFHGFETLADPRADTGILEGNPCHEIALKIARGVGVDFLLNVAITRDRQIAGIYAGDLQAAHAAGCRQVADWTTAEIGGAFDLVITCGGGFPLDATFYQTVKGMVTAMPALGETSTLLQVSDCAEQLGSAVYTELMLGYDNLWRRFLADIEADEDHTKLDQWEYQMQARVLDRIGLDRLWFASDGIPQEMQRHISVTPLLGDGDARSRAQAAIDRYVAAHPAHPKARIAVIPEGPYTMLRVTS